MTTFEGCDFGELLDALGIGDSLDRDEDRIADLRDMLDRSYGPVYPYTAFTSQGAEAIQDMREWLATFNEAAEGRPDHADTLFAGLAEIEHDWTFARYFCVLMVFMWR